MDLSREHNNRGGARKTNRLGRHLAATPYRKAGFDSSQAKTIITAKSMAGQDCGSKIAIRDLIAQIAIGRMPEPNTARVDFDSQPAR
jgi:hypothetical protein